MVRSEKIKNRPSSVFKEGTLPVNISKESVGVLAFGPLALIELNAPTTAFMKITSNVYERKEFRERELNLQQFNQGK